MEVTIKDITTRERKWGYNDPTTGRWYPEQRKSRPDAPSRVYVFVDGEGFWDGFANREARPSQLYRTVLPEVFRRLGLYPQSEARWSQYAGCSCRCSPGFVLTGQRLGYDIYVTLEAGAPTFVATPETVARRAVRAEKAIQLAKGGI